MRIWQQVLLGMIVLSAAFWPLNSALSATVSGRASTVLEWHDDIEGDTAVPVYQYLLLNVKDMDDDGLNVRLYGRAATDLSNKVDAESRLYYGYLEKKNIFEGLDFKLGRQFISTTAGASLMDGLYLSYRNLGPFGGKLFGGGDVSYYEGYNSEDLIVGGELYAQFLENLNLALSYVQKWDDSELANELFGVDIDYTYQSMLNIYNETQFDYLSNSVSYFLLGANYYGNPKWSLRTEYLYSLPVFSSSSIYSVFAVAEYQELMAELNYRIRTGLRSFARLTHEMYEDFDDANLIEIGLEKIRTERFSGYLIGTLRDDEEGEGLYGVKARVAYLFAPKFQAGIGAHIDVLERNIDQDTDETTSSSIWLDGTCYINRTFNLEAKVERVESNLYDEYYTGRMRLNVLF